MEHMKPAYSRIAAHAGTGPAARMMARRGPDAAGRRGSPSRRGIDRSGSGDHPHDRGHARDINDSARATDPRKPGSTTLRRDSVTTRASHRIALFGDRDILHVAAVAAAACALSAGVVYLGYFVHVLRVARRAPCRPERGECVLLFGKHAPGGRIDHDFEARLDRAVSLWSERPPRSVVLLGGGAADQPSEAELARRGLLARGIAADAPIRLEAHSRDTLENLRNARELLGEGMRARVTLLSSRYHLARCAWFARQLGYDFELCAAEPRLRLGPRMLLRLAGEAGYVCLSDVGARWARLIGSQRMLARLR